MSWFVWQLAFNVLTTCIVVCMVLIVRRYRTTRYSAGWIEGRIAMIESMADAQMRDLEPEEWIRLEAERDAKNHLPELAAKLRELDEQRPPEPS